MKLMTMFWWMFAAASLPFIYQLIDYKSYFITIGAIMILFTIAHWYEDRNEQLRGSEDK